MKKILTALAVAATMIIVAVAAPDSADARRRGGHGGGVAAGIIGGLAAGAILGSMAAQQQGYYGDGHYYGQGPYAYEPAPVYVVPPRVYRGGGCWIATDTARGFGYYGPCY